MIFRSFEKAYEGVTAKQIWQVWQDVSQWHTWDPDIEAAKLNGPFAAGSHIMLKPEGAPEVELTLVEVEPHRTYVDECRFFGATLRGSHFIKEQDGSVCLEIQIALTGPLAFIWYLIVGRGIVKTLPEQTDNLVALARKRG